MGQMVQGASLQTKIAFSSVFDASLVKIIRASIERRNLSETSVAGKATRRFVKLIAQLTFGMHAGDLKQMTLFQRQDGVPAPGSECQVIKCLVDILKLSGQSIDKSKDKQRGQQEKDGGSEGMGQQ